MDRLKLAKQGDNKALTELYRESLPIINKLSNKYMHNSGSLTFEDLTQEAYIYFHKAIMSFDETKGTDLKTHIYNSIALGLKVPIEQKGKIVRIPQNIERNNYKIFKAMDKLKVDISKDNLEELSKETGLDIDEINKVSKAMMDSMSNTVDEATLAEVESYETKRGDEMLQTIEDIFSLQTRNMIEDYIGYYGDKLTKEEISKKYGIKRYEFDRTIDKIKEELKGEGF